MSATSLSFQHKATQEVFKIMLEVTAAKTEMFIFFFLKIHMHLKVQYASHGNTLIRFLDEKNNTSPTSAR